ncbi:hypothetical protein V6N13_048621 [Hibiscus sabdariffa]
MYGSSKFVTQEMTVVIIPALMHRIPSELRIKRAWARVVLGYVTSWEVLVLHPYFWFGNGRFSDIAAYKDGVIYGSSKFVTQEMTYAIIPAQMHRIPSELRSEACLGESSTRMGDLLGSPRVATLFLVWERPFQ